MDRLNRFKMAAVTIDVLSKQICMRLYIFYDYSIITKAAAYRQSQYSFGYNHQFPYLINYHKLVTLAYNRSLAIFSPLAYRNHIIKAYLII